MSMNTLLPTIFIGVVLILLIISYRGTKYANRPLSEDSSKQKWEKVWKKVLKKICPYITSLCFAAFYALTVSDTLTVNSSDWVKIDYLNWLIFTIISFIAVIGIAIYVNEITSSNKPDNSPEQQANSAQPTDNSKPDQPKSH